jgi:hypothetical protein
MDPAWDLRDSSVPIRVTVFHPEEIFYYFISTMLPLSNFRFRIVEFVKLSYDDEILIIYSSYNRRY